MNKKVKRIAFIVLIQQCLEILVIFFAEEANLFDKLTKMRQIVLELLLSLIKYFNQRRIATYMLANRRPNKKNSFNTELKKVGQHPLLKLHDYSLHFMNPQGKQCRLIQKRDNCFCGHRFDAHVYHESNKLHCASLGCDCKSFEFIPNISIKCLCKHNNLAHAKENKRCEKCSSCLGFTTDLYCKCGYRFTQHNNHTVLRVDKQNQRTDTCNLPLICKNSYEAKDQVKETLSKSMLQQKIIERESIEYGEKIQNSEHYRQEFLKEKLRVANKRYFSKFTQEKQIPPEQYHQTSAFDLYIQPHFYKNVSLTKFIHHTLLH